jgi:hypothetical protein
MISHLIDGETIGSLLHSLPTPVVVALSVGAGLIVAAAAFMLVKASRRNK